MDFLRRLPDSRAHFARGDSLLRRLHIDWLLLLLLLILTVFGLLVLYSASGKSIAMVNRQMTFYIVAYICMFTIAQLEVTFLKRWSLWFYAIGVCLLLLIFVIGVNAKGAQRWLSLGFIRFQPSEALKLAVPILISAYFSSRILPPKLPHVFWSLVFIFIPTLLILNQPDLGTAILIAASGLIVLFFTGVRWRFIIGSIILLGASLLPIWHFVLEEYQKRRVLTLFNPDADKLGAGWNSIQAKISIGSGGFSGKGWLNGTQSQLDFLPESHTDFIIAALAEEFGLRGVLALLMLYIAIIIRGLVIAWRAKQTFNRLLAASITLTFFVYVFVNIGMVAGLLPVVGVPLPLVSLGGTSLVTLMIAFGILMAIATEREKTKK